MYKIIKNPKTNRYVSINSKYGKNILNNYINIVGGGFKYRFWFIGETDKNMLDPNVVQFLEFISSIGNVKNSGLGLGQCRAIAGVIANNLKQKFTTWESGIMFFSFINQMSTMETFNEINKNANAEMIIHRTEPQTVAFTYDPINQIIYILDFADGNRFDIVIGKCSNDEFFTGPSWWYDGTLTSLYGGPNHDPSSQNANLSRDLSGCNVWSLNYESCTRCNPVPNFIWNAPSQFKEPYFKTSDPNVSIFNIRKKYIKDLY